MSGDPAILTQTPRRNPAYYEDLTPADFSPIAGLGFELWSMTDGILFDNIYLGQSEADLDQFIAETYALKAPIEQAHEEADKAKLDEDAKKLKEASGEAAAGEPDMKTDPVGWVKFKVQQFVDEAVQDPAKAFVERPLTGGALGVVFATLFGMVGVGASSLCLPLHCLIRALTSVVYHSVLSLLFPGSALASAPKAQAQVQAAAQKAAAKAAEVVDQVKEDVPAEEAADTVQEVADGVRTRSTRAKVAARENAKEASS